MAAILPTGPTGDLRLTINPLFPFCCWGANVVAARLSCSSKLATHKWQRESEYSCSLAASEGGLVFHHNHHHHPACDDGEVANGRAQAKAKWKSESFPKRIGIVYQGGSYERWCAVYLCRVKSIAWIECDAMVVVVVVMFGGNGWCQIDVPLENVADEWLMHTVLFFLQTEWGG